MRLDLRIYIGIIGLSWLVVGVLAQFRQGFYSSGWGEYIDFGAHHHLVGAVLIAAGAAALWFAIKASRRTPGVGATDGLHLPDLNDE